jgi:hypothetical protein
MSATLYIPLAAGDALIIDERMLSGPEDDNDGEEEEDGLKMMDKNL